MKLSAANLVKEGMSTLAMKHNLNITFSLEEAQSMAQIPCADKCGWIVYGIQKGPYTIIAWFFNSEMAACAVQVVKGDEYAPWTSTPNMDGVSISREEAGKMIELPGENEEGRKVYGIQKIGYTILAISPNTEEWMVNLAKWPFIY